jgi:site-specific DNA recombinase
MPGKTRRVVLYRRVSALMGRGGADFLSPDIQLDAMRRATSGMVEVGAPVDDIDISGTTFSREGIDKIRGMIERHEVDAIGVYDVSRLGRNVLESLQFLAWIEKHGVTIISACEQVDTSTPAGKLMLTNMLSIAEYRSGEIGAGWSRTIARRAAQGKHHGKPFGYRMTEGRLEPDPVHGPAVTWAFEAYAAGKPIGEIARQIADRTGRRMFTSNIKKWYRNPAYLGHVHADGEIVVYDAHPPLTTQPIWGAVHARLSLDTVAPPRHLAPTWSLVGITFCPDGHRIQRAPTTYRGERVDRLLCGMGVSRGVAYACEGIGEPRLDAVEAEVLRQVGSYIALLRTDEAARATRRAARATASVERQGVERELSRVRSAMTKLAKAWALDDVPDSGYHQPMAELQAAEAELQRQLLTLQRPVVTASPKTIAAAGERLLKLWPGRSAPERNRALRLVVRRVVVRRAARWREPEADRVTVEF